MTRFVARFDKNTVEQVKKAYKGKCFYCGDVGGSIDHFVPISKGGTNDLSNLILSCKKCNTIAGGTLFGSIDEKRAYILSRYATHRTYQHDGRNKYLLVRKAIRKMSKEYRAKGDNVTAIILENMASIDYYL